MKLSESFTPQPAEIEKIEREITPVSPEVEIVFGSDQLVQYGSTIEAYIAQQSEDITVEAQQKIESSATSTGVSPELLDAVKVEYDLERQIAGVQYEADQLTREASLEISEVIVEKPPQKPEIENNLSWKQSWETPAGKEFFEALNAVVDGKPDIVGDRIMSEYTLREFVRKNPEGARWLNDVFQKEFGKPHPDLERAYKEVNELQQTPPEVPPENPKYAGLAYSMNDDIEYQKLREEIETQHRKTVFGATDLRTIPRERFMECCNTRANLTFSSDRETERLFRQKFPEKSVLYDGQERSRVYRDPDGMINRDRDPSFLKMFKPNKYGEGVIYNLALRKFAMIYPEKALGYAERYPDLRQFIKRDEQGPKETKTQPFEKPRETVAPKLLEAFEQAGIKSKVIKVENGSEFPEVIILDKKEVTAEKLVRLYRGVNDLDGSVLEQIPYAMRAENETGKPTILENVRQEVESLAKNPTYENLTIYLDKVRSSLSPKEIRNFDEDLTEIEEGILEGRSARREFVFKQAQHNGGWGDSGLTPYISASFDPREAAGYGRKGLIVMDVPLSEIEGFSADTTEINIKGALDKKYITAIVPRKHEGTKEKEQINQELYLALQKISENTQAVLFEEEELRAEREKILAEEAELDKERWKKDVEKVRQKRVDNLMRRFPEIKLSTQIPTEQAVDVYTKAKRDIFDFYKARLEKIGRNGRKIQDHEYQESDWGERKRFDRDKANDIMLLKLRDLVVRLEELEVERKRR